MRPAGALGRTYLVMAAVQASIATAEHLLYDEEVDHATRFGEAEGEARIQMCVNNYGLKDMSHVS